MSCVMMPRVVHKLLNGIHISKIDKLQLRILNGQVDHCSAREKNGDKVCQVIHETRWFKYDED